MFRDISQQILQYLFFSPIPLPVSVLNEGVINMKTLRQVIFQRKASQAPAKHGK